MSDARHRAAERWLRKALEDHLRESEHPKSTGEIVELIVAALDEAELWLQELLPQDKVERALEMEINVQMAADINRVVFHLEVDNDDAED